SATGADAGSATEEVSATYGADDMDIGFNSKYLLDITSQIDGENARFLFADAGSPTIVRDTADEGSLYVLMPMGVECNSHVLPSAGCPDAGCGQGGAGCVRLCYHASDFHGFSQLYTVES